MLLQPVGHELLGVDEFALPARYAVVEQPALGIVGIGEERFMRDEIADGAEARGAIEGGSEVGTARWARRGPGAGRTACGARPAACALAQPRSGGQHSAPQSSA